MFINEILTEFSHTSSKIDAILRKKGYKRLGAGVDQSAYLEPDTGLVLKIFGTQGNNKGFSSDQKMFFNWYEYCTANKGNQFLPDFYGHETFTFGDEGDRYLQIRAERLFPLSDRPLARAIEDFANRVEHGAKLEQIIRKTIDKGSYAHHSQSNKLDIRAEPGDDTAMLLVNLGEAGVVQLYHTIRDLVKIARRKGYRVDLHSGNFMLGSDSHIVVNDPWVVD